MVLSAIPAGWAYFPKLPLLSWYDFRRSINTLLKGFFCPRNSRFKRSGIMKVNYQTQNQLMKKVSFIIFSVFILSASRIQAQGIHIGIKAGVNLGQVNGRSFDDGYKVGFSAGGFAELNFTSKWGIQPEVLFNQTNTTTVNSFNEIIPQGINNQSTKLNYLSIPILLSYKPIPLLSFQLGPQFGILMNSSQTIVGNGKNAFKT